MKKNVATVKNVSLDKKTREILIVCSAKGSIYVQEPKGSGFPQFMNAGPLVEGLNILLEHHYNAVNAMKGNKEFNRLIEENYKLKTILSEIVEFEGGERIKMGSLTYQKSINEHSFYSDLKKKIEKLVIVSQTL